MTISNYLVEKIIGILKKDPTYRLNTKYTVRKMWYIVFYRFTQLIRGIVVKLKVTCDGFVFCGRAVKIEHGYLLKAGKSLIIEDNVFISALSEDGILLGDNVTIAKSAILVCTGVIKDCGVGIRIGNNSAIGAHSFLGGQGGISIGDDVIMGPHVKIFSENHNFDDISIPIRKQAETRKVVVVEDDCWIGAGSTILAGVKIGRGSIVAAGAVVTKNIEPYSIVSGIPAKLLKKRSP
jgi:acetyltransferase-like isoleucine patch superfamily enzyme